MPKGKRNITPKNTEQNVHVTEGKVTLKAFLFKIRDLCRNKGAQMDENGNIYADLIYDDLLFLKHVWWLAEKGILTMDTNAILEGLSITDVKLDSIASLKQQDLTHVGNVFDRLWTGLQRSNLKDIFERQFPLTAIKKDDKLKAQYLPLLADLLEYVGKVQLADHEDTDPYEYFTQDLKKSKSKYFGQFYTPQTVTESCVEEIQPKYGESGLDPAAGTGKFMRTGAHYIHRNQPEYSEWEAFQHMRTIEIESKIYRQGVLGTFIKYKQLPNMNYLRKGNSFDILPKEDEQFDYILGNPPYGGTVDGFEDLYYDTEMVVKGKRTVSKKVVKPTIRHPFPFIKKDTSVLFLQLCVNKLKVGGRGAVVFNGTIMNDSHREIMKWFLDSCDLRKIIVNPSGTFLCTGIETYSLIFWKGSPTQKIAYYEVGTKKKLGEFTRAEVEARNWDIRPIFADTTVQATDIQYLTIEHLCKVTKGTIQASKAVPGDYKMYSAAKDVATHNEYTYEGEAVIFVNSSRGPPLARVHYANVGEKFAASGLVLVLQAKNSEINMKYLWYYLTMRKGHILKMFESSNMRETINTSDFIKYSVPIPPLPIQQEIVQTLDRIYNPGTTDLADTLKLTSQAMDLVLANPGGATLEPIVDAQRLIRKSAQMVADVKAQMVAIVKASCISGEDKPISEVVTLKYGFPFKSADYTTEGLAVVKHNNITDGFVCKSKKQDYMCPSAQTEDYKMVVGDIVISMDFDCGKVGKIVEEGWVLNQRVCLARTSSEKLRQEYLYWILRFGGFYETMQSFHTGSTIKHIGSKHIDMTVLKIPSLTKQDDTLGRLSLLQSQLTALESLQSQSEDNARFILDSYLSTKSDAVENSVADDISEDNISHE